METKTCLLWGMKRSDLKYWKIPPREAGFSASSASLVAQAGIRCFVTLSQSISKTQTFHTIVHIAQSHWHQGMLLELTWAELTEEKPKTQYFQKSPKCINLSDDLEAEIRSKMICLGGGQWQCSDCSLVTKSTNLYNHIEGKHVNSAGHHCQLCGKFCRTKNGLIAHNHRSHNKNPAVC